MASKEVLLSHGNALDPEEKRVECVHCGKVVPGFNRLQQHIGGVGKDVLECLEAPPDVKEMFRARLIECKIKKLFREVGDFQQPLVLPKRNSSKADEKGTMPAPQKGGSTERRRKRSLSGSIVIIEKLNPSESAGSKARSKSRQFSDKPPSGGEEPSLCALTTLAGSEAKSTSKQLSGRTSYNGKKPNFRTLTALASSEARCKPGQFSGSPSSRGGKPNSGTLADFEDRSQLLRQPSCSKPAPFLRNLYYSGGKADWIEFSQDAQINLTGRDRCTLANSNEVSNLADPCNREDLNANSLIIERKRCIARFLFENGIDFSALKSSSFLSILAIVFAGEATLENSEIPTLQDLKGWILQNELQEIEKYVDEIKRSWITTGCSILLDVWCDDSNRTLMNVLVACPKGTVYLRSMDVTIASQDTEAMELLLDGLIQEVGITNVVQIISDTQLKHIRAGGKRLMERHNSLFYTVSVAYCLELALEAICHMDLVKNVMKIAQQITKFIYSDSSISELLLRSIPQHHMVSIQSFKVVRPFLTLLNLSVHSQNVKDMFSSPDWKNSPLAQTGPGLFASFVVVYGSIWEDMAVVLRGAIPLIQALYRVKKDDEQAQMGFIFELLCNMKESIRRNLGNQEHLYEPFCSIIDKIWCSVFQKSIHCVGYFLNPQNRYFNKFQDDVVVRMGFRKSLREMIPGRRELQKNFKELGLYSYRIRVPTNGYGVQDLQGVSPAEWWYHNGGEWPHLQKLAIRVLSQTCQGASSYGLRRSSAEKYLSEGMNNADQQFLKELTYVHYNLHLKEFKAEMIADCECSEIDPFDDWI